VANGVAAFSARSRRSPTTDMATSALWDMPVYALADVHQ